MDDGRLRFPIQRQAEQQSCRCKRRHPTKVRFKTIPAFCRNLFPAGTLTKLAHHLKQIEKEQDFDNPFSGLGQVLRAAKECYLHSSTQPGFHKALYSDAYSVVRSTGLGDPGKKKTKKPPVGSLGEALRDPFGLFSQVVQPVQATSVVRLCVLRYAYISTYIPRYLHIPIPLTVVSPVSLPKRGQNRLHLPTSRGVTLGR